MSETFRRKHERLDQDIKVWEQASADEKDSFRHLVERAFRQQAIRMKDIFSLQEAAFKAITNLKNQIDAIRPEVQGKDNLEQEVIRLKQDFDRTLAPLNDIIKKINDRDAKEDEKSGDNPFYG